MAERKPLRSDIAWSTPDAIGVHGYDLCQELMGEINFGDMAFLEVTGRLPGPGESRLFNAILVTLVEHGIVPSTLAARLTHAGAPEAMQAAVAAGLLGLGSVFVGSTEGAARMLADAIARDAEGRPQLPPQGLEPLALELVQAHRARKQILPGLGHPVHKPLDPRSERLFALARQTGFDGPYVALMQQVAAVATRETGRPLPVNATGAIGALCCELGLPWQVARGLGVMARSVGLVGHILEESRQPMALELWQRTEEEASAEVRGQLRRTRERS